MTVCDVCNNEVDWESSYILTSTQVTTSEAYWTKTFGGIWSYVHAMDPSGDSLGMLVQQQAGQSTGWMVCESCSYLFSFNKPRAREYARAHNGSPPGVGPAPTGDASRAAANAWHRLYGTWPSSLKFREPKPVQTPVETPPIPTTVTTNLEQFCRFCKAKRPADGLPVKAVLFKKDGNKRSEHHIYVPRCTTCQAIHKKQTPYITRIVPIAVIGSMALCPLVGFIGAKSMGGWSWALGAGIGLAGIGVVLLSIVIMRKTSGTETEAYGSTHLPEFQLLSSQGWLVDLAKSRTATPGELGVSQPPAYQEPPAIYETPVVEMPIPAEVGSEYIDLSRDIAVKEGKILCGKCGKPILTIAEVQEKYSGYQAGGGQLVMGSMETFFQREADKNAIGVTCAACGHHFCVECMNKHGKAHPTSGGKGCLDCGGRMKDFARPFTG